MSFSHSLGIHALVKLDKTNTFLFPKRSDYKPKHVFHRDLPGGKPESGEQMHEAMRRELQEEAGINQENIVKGSFMCLGCCSRWSNKKEKKRGTVIYYTLIIKHDNISLSHEHTQYQRLTLKEALQLEPRRSIIDAAIDLYLQSNTSASTIE